MRSFILSLSLVLLGHIGYSQVTEDTSINVVPDVASGIVYFNAPEKIDSVEIKGLLDEVVFNQKIYGENMININFIPRSCYYIVFTTEKGEKKIQKLFFNKEMTAEK